MEDVYIDAEVRRAMRFVLRDAYALRDNPSGHYGLCATLGLRVLPKDLVTAIFESWSHYTGHPDYPVPEHADSQYDVAAACGVYRTTDDMYVGEYGALRLSLLAHLIAELEKLVD